MTKLKRIRQYLIDQETNYSEGSDKSPELESYYWWGRVALTVLIEGF